MKRAPQPKSQAAILIREMQAAGIEVKNQQALEMVAKMSGFRDWNAMSGTVDTEDTAAKSEGSNSAVPVIKTANEKPNASTLLEVLLHLATDVCQEHCGDDLPESEDSAVQRLDAMVRELTKPGYSDNPMLRFDQKRQIAVLWDIDDVLEVRPDLTETEAFDVLQRAKHKHDASIGISYDTLENWADWMFDVRTLPCTVTFTTNDGNRIENEPAVVKLSDEDEVGGIHLVNGLIVSGTIQNGECAKVRFETIEEPFDAYEGKLDYNDVRQAFAALESAGLLPDVTKD